MKYPIEHFRSNIERVKNLGKLHQAIKSQTTSIVDLSDMLRAELVLAVSALDHYIHEAVEDGMIESYVGTRPQSKDFLKFQIQISNIDQIKNSTNTNWLRDTIRNRHQFESFQKSEKISNALKLISDVKLWEEVSKRMNDTSQNLKLRLDLIVDRRNKIAHEADVNPTFPRQQWYIDEKIVDDAIQFMIDIAENIDSTV